MRHKYYMKLLRKSINNKYLHRVHTPHVFLAAAEKYSDFEDAQFYFETCLDLIYEIEEQDIFSAEKKYIAVFWLKQYNSKKSVTVLDRPKQEIHLMLQEYLHDDLIKI